MVAARVLATYLVPGCVERGVRLGSESSSATAAVGGVWEPGNLEIWDLGNLEIWGPGNPEILRVGDLETQKFGQKIIRLARRGDRTYGKFLYFSDLMSNIS